MTIFIDNQSGAPIYDQIFSQVRGQILSGVVAQDAPLPSIRALAKDLRISVITTKRAYDELESAGFIYTLPGKGSFVSARDAELHREAKLKEIGGKLRELRALADAYGVADEEICDMYKKHKEERE